MEQGMISQAKKQPAYTRRNPNEYGFYIACDDRSILRCVNTMLLNNGIVGLSDESGRLHYLIDGRRGSSFVKDKLSHKILSESKEEYRHGGTDEVFVMHAIDAVISKYGLSPRLVGTQIVRRALREVYYDPKLLKGVSKVLYPRIGESFKMSPPQIERNLRYCFQKSKRIGKNCRVLTTLLELYDATLSEIYGDYGR